MEGIKQEQRPNLEELRVEIDKCDKEIIQVIARRMKLIPLVASFKRENNLPRYQPVREKKIIENRRSLAEELGLSPDLVEEIIKLIIKDSHRIEENIIGS